MHNLSRGGEGSAVFCAWTGVRGGGSAVTVGNGGAPPVRSMLSEGGLRG